MQVEVGVATLRMANCQEGMPLILNDRYYYCRYTKMSAGSHQYFRTVPDIDKELEHLLQFVLKSGSSEPETNSNAIHTVTYVNSRVTPVIQSGPMCGLVALTMASDVLKGPCKSTSTINDDVHPEELLRLSKDRRLSNKGEIFAVEYLKQIAQERLQDCHSEVVSLEMVDVVDTVLSGKSLLVPYDADKDHTPCLQRGHNAHWCLVVGIIVTVSIMKDDHLYSLIFECCSPSPSLPGHFITREDKVASLLANKQLITSSLTQVYVFTRHGKSSHLGLWKFSDLLESNKNLLEVDPKRTRPGEYIIPCGGIKEGLCGKALIISNKLSS